MSFEHNENVNTSEDGREVPMVVGVVTASGMRRGVNEVISGPALHNLRPGETLMTVAQCNRIVAAKDAEIAHLSSLFGELHLARNLLSRLSGLGFDMSGEDSFFAELEQLLTPAAVLMPERKPIPEGLLQKLAHCTDPDCCIAHARGELRALLGKEDEHCP